MSVVASLINSDTSFFEITSSKINERVLSEDIISFSYTEELGRYNTGTLSIYDPEHYYSKVLRFGAPLDIKFGYTKRDAASEARIKKENPAQIFGASIREGIKAYVQNPKGTAGSNGVVTFNCNFYSQEVIGIKQYKMHTGITKKELVENLFNSMGITDYTVKFTQEKDRLNADTQRHQRMTDYKMLLSLARDWRALFRVSYNSKGKLSAIFISPQYLDLKEIPVKLSGAVGGDSLLLDYKEGEYNVLEYTWEHHLGKSGSGDNVRIIQDANGKPTFIRYVTKGETVKAYKLNQDKIKEKLKEQSDFSTRAEKLKEWVNTDDFEKVKWAFDPIELSTAPQGLGYSANIKMLGMPLMSVPLKVFFGKGFPVFFSPKISKGHVVSYFCNKITHNISQAGYFMDLEIADAFTVQGGALL